MKDDYYPLNVIHGPEDGPAPFAWDAWYGSVGGRTINIPEVDTIMREIVENQYPRFTSPLAESRLHFADAAEASRWVKERARLHGADIIGICAVEETDVYAEQSVSEPFAIVLGKKMVYESFVTVPSHAAALECMRIYEDLGEVVLNLAKDLRDAGFPATVEHPLGDSRVMHVPLALKAGFGELGRHGSIINTTYGPLFRIGSVLTTLDMEVDSPVNAGIGAFCDRCQACRIFCPADAIPDERSPGSGKDPQGNDRYMIDTGKCFPYFATHDYCSACLAVCAYKHKQWATLEDGSIGPFPQVPFGDPSIVVDPAEAKHNYPKIRRNESSPFHR